jgi:Predicted transcriptional regulators
MLLNCIAKVREAQGLKQWKLARKVFLSPATLCKIENGQQSVSDRQLFAIARALGVPPSSLLLDRPLPCNHAIPRKRGTHV